MASNFTRDQNIDFLILQKISKLIKNCMLTDTASLFFFFFKKIFQTFSLKIPKGSFYFVQNGQS